jgi:hypothetical protein
MKPTVIDLKEINTEEELKKYLLGLIPDQATFDKKTSDRSFSLLQIAIKEKFGVEGLGTLHLHLEQLK